MPTKKVFYLDSSPPWVSGSSDNVQVDEKLPPVIFSTNSSSRTVAPVANPNKKRRYHQNHDNDIRQSGHDTPLHGTFSTRDEKKPSSSRRKDEKSSSKRQRKMSTSTKKYILLKPIDAQNGHIDSSDDQIINIVWEDEKTGVISDNTCFQNSHEDNKKNASYFKKEEESRDDEMSCWRRDEGVSQKSNMCDIISKKSSTIVTTSKGAAKKPAARVKKSSVKRTEEHTCDELKKSNQSKRRCKNTIDSKSFEDWFKDLVSFKLMNGHCDVPSSKKDPSTHELSLWCTSMRSRYSVEREYLNPDHIRRLHDIGFRWESHRRKLHKKFDDRFNMLVEYKRLFGDTNVQRTDKLPREYYSLAAWCSKIRQIYRGTIKASSVCAEMNLDEEKIRKLDSIGFQWVKRKGRQKN